MIAILTLVALIGLVCFVFGYILGTSDQREANAKAMAKMAREAAREMAREYPEAG